MVDCSDDGTCVVRKDCDGGGDDEDALDSANGVGDGIDGFLLLVGWCSIHSMCRDCCRQRRSVNRLKYPLPESGQSLHDKHSVPVAFGDLLQQQELQLSFGMLLLPMV